MLKLFTILNNMISWKKLDKKPKIRFSSRRLFAIPTFEGRDAEVRIKSADFERVICENYGYKNELILKWQPRYLNYGDVQSLTGIYGEFQTQNKTRLQAPLWLLPPSEWVSFELEWEMMELLEKKFQLLKCIHPDDAASWRLTKIEIYPKDAYDEYGWPLPQAEIRFHYS